MILYVLSLKRKAGVFIDLKFVVGCCWSWGFGAAKMGEEKKKAQILVLLTTAFLHFPWTGFFAKEKIVDSQLKTLCGFCGFLRVSVGVLLG